MGMADRPHCRCGPIPGFPAIDYVSQREKKDPCLEILFAGGLAGSDFGSPKRLGCYQTAKGDGRDSEG